MGNIIIKNPEKLREKARQMAADGPGKLHVLSDFDRTFTKACVGGEEVPSLISILRDENYLTPDYPAKAKALFAKYHPIEMDPNISPEEKSRAMRQWWSTHFKLLIKSGLNRKDLEKAVLSGRSQFRKNALEFIDLLHKNGIPLVFLSSGGLGGDAIAMRLKKEGRLYEKVHIICNTYEWDEAGNAVGVKEPIIHTANKNEVMLKDFPFFGEIKDRKNVLLLGDNVEDLGMIEGFDYDNLLSVGFLNKNIGANLTNYESSFDAVVAQDGEMTYVLDLLKDILGNRI